MISAKVFTGLLKKVLKPTTTLTAAQFQYASTLNSYKYSLRPFSSNNNNNNNSASTQSAAETEAKVAAN